jgi:hypothetical protein
MEKGGSYFFVLETPNELQNDNIYTLASNMQLLTRCQRDLLSSGMFRNAKLWLFTDVSGQSILPHLKIQ